MKASGEHDNPTENFSISYDLTDMIVDSATLWVWAQDDQKNGVNDSGNEAAAITKIEGASWTHSSDWTEIDNYGTYFGYDVLSFIGGSNTSPLTALIAVQNSGSKDFYFENAKLDVTYHTAPCPPPVPLPAAAWLFGSALLGFVSLSNRRRV
jgi:hypothetical protein